METTQEAIEIVKSDITEVEGKVKSEVVDTETKLKTFLQKFSDAFHRYALYVTVALVLGAYVGVMASKKYYTTKLEEITKVGGMLVKDQVYSVTKK
jgi:hypothetical protein